MKFMHLENNGNKEISSNYVITSKRCNQEDICVDTIFAYNVSHSILNENRDYEHTYVEKCRHRDDWPMRKKCNQVRIRLFGKHKVFGLVFQTLKEINR